MKVVTKNVGPCRKALQIEVPVDSATVKYNEAVDAFAKVAKVPGFRPGKAPRNLVERRYARQIVEEVKDRLIPESYHKALADEELVPVAVVDLQAPAYVHGQPFSFTATVDIRPKFKLPRYKGLSLKGTKVEVSDKDVDEAIEALRERAATFQDISDSPAQTGDFVQIDFAASLDGQPLAQRVPEQKGLCDGNDFWMVADERQFTMLPPAFVNGVVGLNPGEQKELDCTFPKDFHVKELAGLAARYSVRLKALRRKNLPPVDQDFFKHFEVQSLPELRDTLRQRLLEEAERTERRRLRNEVTNRLLTKTKMDLPESVVLRETHQTVQTIVRQSAAQGATKEQIEERKEDILNTARQSSVAKVRLDYILARIAEEENITVEENEIDQRVRGLAAAYRVPLDRLKSELAGGDGLDKIRHDLMSEKTLDFVVESAKISR
ncbi:MAG: trigger factor [Kiritimatiellae bacterium]|nr:trigger factor [Kiritimatiellia bacterium]